MIWYDAILHYLATGYKMNSVCFSEDITYALQIDMSQKMLIWYRHLNDLITAQCAYIFVLFFGVF